MKFDIIIGCEVHVQLLTRTKAFCPCENRFGGEPNSRLCPVCVGLPGALPVTNRQMIDFAIRAGSALHCTIAPLTKFDRKNYLYPDMPKGYQISQFDMPICEHGYLEIPTESGEEKKIRILRAHLEEDAGKNIHMEDGSGLSRVDLNRCGTPLLEIVSEPDMRSPDEAVRYVQGLKDIMEWLGISDCNMEEGSLRCDANINLWIYEDGKKYATPIVEVKNMNSFRSMRAALVWEVERQAEEWRQKRITLQQSGKKTRGYDEKTGKTLLQRHKEEASEYRYFPEPDLKPIRIPAEHIAQIAADLPELPAQMRLRLEKEYEVTPLDAEKLTSSRQMAEYFQAACRGYGGEPKRIANWLLTEAGSVLNAAGIGIEDFSVPPEDIRALMEAVDKGTISGKIAKSVFTDMVETGKNPDAIIAEKGLTQIDDSEAIRAVITEVIDENPKSADDYRGGKMNALSFLMGQVMKKTKGKANPKLASDILKEELERG